MIPFGKNTHNEPINHATRMQEVTDVQVIIPSTEPFSNAVDTIQQQGLVKFFTGKEHLLTIEFDCAIQQQVIDFRPHLPLRFRW